MKTQDVIGKVSIGLPVEEPVLTRHSPSLDLRNALPAYGLIQGERITQEAADTLQRAGVEEVHIVRGRRPEQLATFRIQRPSFFSGHYVEDHATYTELGIAGRPVTIPIVLSVHNVEEALSERRKSYDRNAKKYACVNCAVEGKRECAFARDKNRTAQSPCRPDGRFFFHILPSPGEVAKLGGLYKFQTTSLKTINYLRKELEEIHADNEGIFGIPMELEIRFEETTIGYNEMKMVPHVHIRSSKEIVERYAAQKDVLKSALYRHGILAQYVIDEQDPQSYDAEFRPDVAVRIFDEEQNKSTNEVVVAHDDSYHERVKTARLTSKEREYFAVKKLELESLARQMDPEDYWKYQANLSSLTPANVDQFTKRCKHFISSVPEKDRQANFDINATQ